MFVFISFINVNLILIRYLKIGLFCKKNIKVYFLKKLIFFLCVIDENRKF